MPFSLLNTSLNTSRKLGQRLNTAYSSVKSAISCEKLKAKTASQYRAWNNLSSNEDYQKKILKFRESVAEPEDSLLKILSNSDNSDNSDNGLKLEGTQRTQDQLNLRFMRQLYSLTCGADALVNQTAESASQSSSEIQADPLPTTMPAAVLGQVLTAFIKKLSITDQALFKASLNAFMNGNQNLLNSVTEMKDKNPLAQFLFTVNQDVVANNTDVNATARDDLDAVDAAKKSKALPESTPLDVTHKKINPIMRRFLHIIHPDTVHHSEILDDQETFKATLINALKTATVDLNKPLTHEIAHDAFSQNNPQLSAQFKSVAPEKSIRLTHSVERLILEKAEAHAYLKNKHFRNMLRRTVSMFDAGRGEELTKSGRHFFISRWLKRIFVGGVDLQRKNRGDVYLKHSLKVFTEAFKARDLQTHAPLTHMYNALTSILKREFWQSPQDLLNKVNANLDKHHKDYAKRHATGIYHAAFFSQPLKLTFDELNQIMIDISSPNTHTQDIEDAQDTDAVRVVKATLFLKCQEKTRAEHPDIEKSNPTVFNSLANNRFKEILKDFHETFTNNQQQQNFLSGAVANSRHQKKGDGYEQSHKLLRLVAKMRGAHAWLDIINATTMRNADFHLHQQAQGKSVVDADFLAQAITQQTQAQLKQVRTNWQYNAKGYATSKYVQHRLGCFLKRFMPRFGITVAGVLIAKIALVLGGGAVGGLSAAATPIVIAIPGGLIAGFLSKNIWSIRKDVAVLNALLKVNTNTNTNTDADSTPNVIA